MRDFIRTYASLAIVAFCLGGIPSHSVIAGCGCSDCAETSCSTCDACLATPRICGLGNGLLDYLDKASGRFEANFFRLRSSHCGCSTACDATCEGMDSGANFSMLNGEIHESQGTIIQNHSGHSHQLPSPPSQGSGSSGSSIESPVPVPIPDPIASPPSLQSTPRKLGNPFTDEARFLPEKDEEFVAPIKTAMSPRLAARSELSFAQVDVKPVPKHLLRGRSVEKTLEEQRESGQTEGDQNQVITAGAIQPTIRSKVQFSR